ncbi:MAG: polysaccharide biosynthesis/export family protein [Fibrobacter sp.]|nr:polysaccharide biosynthesis/export family protein [Fibrobacter sp.]
MSRIISLICFLCIFSFAAEESLFSNSAGPVSKGLSSRSSVAMSPSFAEVQVDSNYVLGPGDFLDIMLEERYLTVQIYPDGSVAIEECGSVIVGGKTFAEARGLILDLVAKRYKREYCFVQLAALKKFRVNAMGAVNQVGQQLVEPQTRLSFFIRQIGGTLPNANTEDVWVIREKDTLHVNYSAMSSKGKFDEDVMLEQGDRVYVPFVALGDNIALIFPGYRTSVAYQEDRTLQDYFELAGGSRMQNYGYKAVCVREPGKAPRWITLSEMKLTKVAPNTEVEFSVQEMLVYVGGAVNMIGRYAYNPSWHALDYAAAAGINPYVGTWSQIKVWRGNKPEALSLSVTEDQILPGDYIEVPRSHYETFKDVTLFLASLLTVVSSAFIIYVNYK